MNKFDKNNAQIGERIREIRLKRNMTQETLSEKAGVCNPQQISNIERGLSGMSIAKFKDILRALDIYADYIEANDGEIGGWQISPSGFTSPDGTVYLYSNSSGN